MSKKEKKEYIEPEIINEVEDKIEDFSKDKIEDLADGVKGLKNAILLKGISVLIGPIIILLLIIIGISWLIMYVIDTHPYDYIVTALFLFIILSPIYKVIKMFK